MLLEILLLEGLPIFSTMEKTLDKIKVRNNIRSHLSLSLVYNFVNQTCFPIICDLVFDFCLYENNNMQAPSTVLKKIFGNFILESNIFLENPPNFTARISLLS